ncbi:carboxymuconolactone decarboxylase family protein [Culicoidibacter larvae]|uniref:Carboxymuconolactone decarboxylase family protein n=1 Tax=Culicoidibacter larvae TaxID=2579976 RepID=A0A5R8QH98_9FIRM|nr:carboxymuconolactone decarboxylase family protein [Culicoidibacter larvae]TLG77405.1 carboxymuconolactone decarboxylase family protein [Culicoidibacter larvae]
MKYNFKLGQENLSRIDGAAGERVIASLQDVAPDIATYIIEFAFGEIYSREYLNFHQRELITISSLATQGGCEAQLEVHIHGALNVGATKHEIIETFIQLVPYIGFPKVLNAVQVAKTVFKTVE